MVKVNFCVPVFAALLCLVGSPGAFAKKPNVILISMDTVAAPHMSSYGNPRLTTPFLDRFARENIVFEKELSSGGYTLPAHVSLFTGTTPFTHHVFVNDFNTKKSRNLLPESIPTLASYLKNKGYQTYWSAPMNDDHFDFETGISRGFDRLHRSLIDLMTTDERDVSSVELRKMIQARGDKPLFLFLHTYLAHDPYKPNPPFNEIFAPELPRKKVETAQDVFHSLIDLFASSRDVRLNRYAWLQQFGFNDHGILPAGKLADAESRKLEALYDGGLRNLDSKIENVFRILREEKIYDDAIIIVTSDHGESFGENGQYLHGQPYMSNLHIPLILKIPGMKPQRISERVADIDVLPTLLDLLSISPDSKIEGQSLVPLLKGQPFHRKSSEHYALGISATSILADDWLFFRNDRQERRLFNLKSDPRGVHDVLQENPERAGKLEAKLSAYAASREPATPKPDHSKEPKKLYWFIPGGVRADHGDFNIFKWAQDGKLPNLRRMMDEGTSGYSIPDFSSSKPISPIWKTLAAAGKKIMFVSVPGEDQVKLEIGEHPPELRPDGSELSFLDDLRKSLDWHKRAVGYVYEKHKLDTFIQSTSAPGQMLGRNPWMDAIDKKSKKYSAAKSKRAWKEILEMYKGLDAILGEALLNADTGTIVAFSSDHGVCPRPSLDPKKDECLWTPFVVWGPGVRQGEKVLSTDFARRSVADFTSAYEPSDSRACPRKSLNGGSRLIFRRRDPHRSSL